MGEYAEMMLDGTCCECCGEFIDDDDAGGYPRYCSKQCASDRGMLDEPKSKKMKTYFERADSFVVLIIRDLEKELKGQFDLQVLEQIIHQLKGIIKHCRMEKGVIYHEPIQKTIENNLNQKIKNKKQGKKHAKKLNHNR